MRLKMRLKVRLKVRLKMRLKNKNIQNLRNRNLNEYGIK